MKTASPAGLLAAIMLVNAASAAVPRLALQMVVDKQIQSPTTITNARDGSGRLFVCEQRGKIHVIKNGVLLPQLFLDLGPKLVAERPAFDERGVLGLTFHPQYAQTGQPGSGKFYIFYSATSPNAPGPATDPVDCRSTVAEFRVSAANPDVADAASERILLSFDKPQFNHNGGQLEFGPDGFLYFSTGDGGSSNDNNAGHTGGSSARPLTNLGNSQDLSRWMGKIHRIDPLGTNGPGGQYGIPADNPLVGTLGAREEIWCYGLRNPWRFSFDRANGRLFCADVGQGEIEEVDIITKGANFGWRNKEGTFIPTFSVGAPALIGNVVDPIAMYAHPGVVKGTPPLPQLGVSITGGFLYRGPAIPTLQGAYVFGDYSQDGPNPKGILLGLEEAGSNWTLSVLDIVSGNPIGDFIQAFGEDESGEIYLGLKRTRGPSEQVNGFPAGAIVKVVAEPLTPTHRQQWEQQYFFVDQLIDPAADVDGDGQGNLMEYAWQRHPRIAEGSGDAFRVSAASGGITVQFWRDPLAIDLTYRLESGDSLQAWSPQIVSTAGAAPVGFYFVGEQDVPGHAPLKEVTGFFPTTEPRTFVRLAVVRP